MSYASRTPSSWLGQRVAQRLLAFPAAYCVSFVAWLALIAGAIYLAASRRQRALPFALARSRT